MVYAVSDIHGCYDKYKKLLKKTTLVPTILFTFWAM